VNYKLQQKLFSKFIKLIINLLFHHQCQLFRLMQVMVMLHSLGTMLLNEHLIQSLTRMILKDTKFIGVLIQHFLIHKLFWRQLVQVQLVMDDPLLNSI